MANGKRQTANGKRQTANGKWQTADGKRGTSIELCVGVLGFTFAVSRLPSHCF